MDEKNVLLQINDQLEDYRKTVMAIRKNDYDDYGYIVLKGTRVCESLLTLLLIQNGYEVEKGRVIQNAERQHFNQSILTFCITARDILPEECRQFLDYIRTYRNHAAHANAVSFQVLYEFSKALDYFTEWVKNRYLTRTNIDQDTRAIVTTRFFSLEKVILALSQQNTHAHVTESSSHSATDSCGSSVYTETGNNYGRSPYTTGGSSYKSSTDTNEQQLLKMLANQTAEIVRLSAMVTRIDLRSERIEMKVDEINEQIRELTDRISAYQSLIERQIAKAASEEEIERLISAYADECAEKITEKAMSSSEENIKKAEERKLILSFGDSWNKMSQSTKTFLISAKVMFNHMVLLDDVIDYSGVCILVTKAIEVEMSKRFYTGFLNYLSKKYGNNYSKYPTSLLFNNCAPLKPDKFTLGTVPYVLCYCESKYDTASQRINNKAELMEYCGSCLFKERTNEIIESLLAEYGEAVERIRKKYRNPAAHTNELKRVDAQECFDLVLDVEKVLKRMLDSFSE